MRSWIQRRRSGSVMCMNSTPDGAAIDVAGFAREFAVDLQVGLGLRAQEAERIEVGLEVSPVPE